MVDSATDFFGMTEISTKESKGWWNEDIKMARNELKILQESIAKRKHLQITMTIFLKNNIFKI